MGEILKNKKTIQEVEIFMSELNQLGLIFNNFFADILNEVLKENKMKEKVIANTIIDLRGKAILRILPEDINHKYEDNSLEIRRNINDILLNLKQREDQQAYVKFLNEYFDILDFSMYLKLFNNANKIEGFAELLKAKYNQTFSVVECNNIFNHAVQIRNEIVHQTNESKQKYQNIEKMEDAVETYSKIYDILKNKKTETTYGAKFNKHITRCKNIIKSAPLSYKQISEIIPMLANEESIKALFLESYDSTNKILYGWQKEELIEKCKIIYYGASTEALPQNKIDKEITKTTKTEMLLLEQYLNNFRETNTPAILTSEDWSEIAKNCTVIFDTSVFLPRVVGGYTHRDYAIDTIAPILKANDAVPLIDYSSRVELNIISDSDVENKCSEKDKSNARHARESIHLLNEHGNLAFIKKNKTLFRKGCYGITDIVNKNPDVRFVVVSQDLESQKYIIDNTNNNCLVVSVNTFGQAGSKILASNIGKLKRFISDLGNRNDESEELLTNVYNNKDDSDDQKQSVVKTEEKPKPSDNENAEVKETIPNEQCKKEVITNSQKQKGIETKVTQQQSAQQNQPSRKSINKQTTIIKETKELLSCSVQLETGSILKDEEGNIYILGEIIGEGGEGCAYEIDSDLVAKIYHKESLTKNRYEKLKLMISNNPKIKKLCYPEKLLFNNSNEFVGYLMPKVPSNYLTLGQSVMKLGNGDLDELVKKNVRLSGLEKWTRYSLTRLCANIAKTFSDMHAHGILMGDINQNNILVNCKNSSGDDFRIIDCDSFQIGPYPCPVGTDEFTSPKIYIREKTDRPQYGTFLRKVEDDEYALASLLFRIFMFGQQPYASKGNNEMPEAQARRSYNFSFRFEDEAGQTAPEGCYSMIWNNMPYNVRRLFVSVFKDGKDVTAKTWEIEINNYTDQIKEGKYTNELIPNRFRDSTGDKTIDITCDLCGKESNMFKNYYTKIIKPKHAMKICPLCQASVVPLIKRKTVNAICECCGKTYEENMYRAVAHDYGDLYYASPLVCPTCNEEVTVKCSGCGKPVIKKRYQIKKGKFIYCRDCLAKVSATCESCGRSIEVSRFQTLNGKKVHCQKCSETVIATCSCCGSTYTTSKYKIKNLNNGGYCSSCREKVPATCSRCGKVMEIPKYKKIKHSRPLCEQCIIKRY